MVSQIDISNDLHQLFKKDTNNNHAVRIILFFAEHPYTRFDELAIIRALKIDSGTRLIQLALADLVRMGIIITRMDNEVTLFSLAENARGLAAELSELNVQQQPQVMPLKLESKRTQTLKRLAASVLTAVPNATV